MPADNTPQAEVHVDTALVRALLEGQHPDIAHLTIEPVDSGWDNVMFRLGDDLAVRLPRRGLAAELVENEQRWLPDLAQRLPLAVPVPVRTGGPGAGYPWRWSVTEWVPGAVAATAPPVDPTAAATALGGFLVAMHTPAPADAPRSPFRAVPLEQRDDSVRERVAILGDAIDSRTVLACWDDLVDTTPWNDPPVWVHGDLHPFNLVTDDGRLSGVIDFGDLTAGDPATDLAAAWMLLPPAARDTLRDHAGSVDDDTWARARGWALALSLAMLTHSADRPAMTALGRRTLDAVLADT